MEEEGELDTTVEEDNISWQSFKALSVLFFFSFVFDRSRSLEVLRGWNYSGCIQFRVE